MKLLNAGMFFAVAILILAQKYTDDSLLVEHWHGLGIAVWILMFNGTINLWLSQQTPKSKA